MILFSQCTQRGREKFTVPRSEVDVARRLFTHAGGKRRQSVSLAGADGRKGALSSSRSRLLGDAPSPHGLAVDLLAAGNLSSFRKRRSRVRHARGVVDSRALVVEEVIAVRVQEA